MTKMTDKIDRFKAEILKFQVFRVCQRMDYLNVNAALPLRSEELIPRWFVLQSITSGMTPLNCQIFGLKIVLLGFRGSRA